MDVTLPDGSLLTDVPDGTTQEQLIGKLYKAGNPNWKAMRWQQMQEHPWGSGVAPLANKLGGAVTDLLSGHVPPEVAGGAGYVANVATQAVPALVGSYRMAGVPETSLAQKPADWLMQSAIKPSNADKASGAGLRAIHTMQQEGVNATTGGMDKVSKLASGLDEQVKNAVAASPESVNIARVGSRLGDVYQGAKTQVNPDADINAVRAVWDQFRNSPAISGKTEISVPLAQALKSGTYKALGGKTYGEMGSTAVEAQKALARGLREEIAAKAPEVVEPLKREAALMNVKDVALNRVLGEANKNPLGLAALRMDNPLSAATFMADKSALVKSLLSRFLYEGGKPSNVAGLGIAAGEVTPQLARQRLADALARKLQEEQ